MQASWPRKWASRLNDSDLPVVLRPAFIAAQAVTILITWPLWQARTTPPPLPVVDGLGQIDMGLILLGTLALVLFKPELGVVAHSAALVAAIVMDQTRLQPEFVSIAIVLWGTTRIPYARPIAAAHLVTLWFWSGLNKALSLGFMDESAVFLFNSFPVHPGFLRDIFGVIVIAAEISIGVLLLVPRFRRVGVLLAIGLHVLGLVALVNVRWNEAVWPWNVVLAVAAVAFFWPAAGERERRGYVPALVVLGILPIGFYAGYVDAYIAHNLYTSNTANAQLCPADGDCSAPWLSTITSLRVPFPPEPRLYRAYFDNVCEQGDTLLVFPRRTRVLFGRDSSPATHDCPAA